jgi:hypothetical protein
MSASHVSSVEVVGLTPAYPLQIIATGEEMIFTSNFKISGKDPRSLAICRSTPKDYRGDKNLILAPSWDIIKLPMDKFAPLYIQSVLKRLDVHQLAKMCQDRILLCWEDNPKECHRSLVMDWFIQNGYECEEISYAKKNKVEDWTQRLNL